MFWAAYLLQIKSEIANKKFILGSQRSCTNCALHISVPKWEYGDLGLNLAYTHTSLHVEGMMCGAGMLATAVHYGIQGCYYPHVLYEAISSISF